jgi:hypothetical protein
MFINTWHGLTLLLLMLMLQTERRKAEKQIQEVAGATFKPEISKLAQNLWSLHECTTAPAWQRLSKGEQCKAAALSEWLAAAQTGPPLPYI